jgi:peptide/nickel transport system permease protein
MSEAAIPTPAAGDLPPSAWRDFRHGLKRVMKSGAFLIGFVIVGFWIFCAIFGSSIVPHDPFADDMLNSLMPPDSVHWFGTDQLGRDVFSRVIAGARDILTVAPLATLISTVLGTALGLTMGYFGGWVDEILSRLVDAVLALPTVIVALLALTALGTSMRAAVLAERNLDYVAAAELRRENRLYIMFVEILPNVLPPILVESTVRLGYSIFTVATLSFIGFGIQPPSPDWGLSISSNYGLIAGGYWWTVLFDGLAIASLVIGVNLMADGIASALDD